jgi:hypothetical protein
MKTRASAKRMRLEEEESSRKRPTPEPTAAEPEPEAAKPEAEVAAWWKSRPVLELSSRVLEIFNSVEKEFGEEEEGIECFCDSSSNFDAIYFTHDGVCPQCGTEMQDEFDSDSDSE